MIQTLSVYFIYLLLLLWLIKRKALFGIFKDEHISTNVYTLIFLLKALAVPAFYFIYKKLYGGIDNLDSGKFYHDVEVIHDFALKDFSFYVKLMFGLQNDLPGSYDFEYCLKNTLNWDNGTVKDYLYNDNRVVIRVHTLIDFIAFNSYFVHGLFSCLMSFIGLQLIYRAFKLFFKEKELLLFLILCFVPALWFYTGALLKEGITVLALGLAIYLSQQVVQLKNLKHILLLLPVIFICCLLKPYLLLFSLFSFLIFYVIYFSHRIQRKVLVFLTVMIGSFVLVNLLSITFKQRSLMEAALKHQRLFAGVAKGGIFLADQNKFIRLRNDSTQISLIDAQKKLYKIHKNVSYMYWLNGNDNDTLYCQSNKDTVHLYELKYTISESKSNIQISSYQGGAIQMILTSYQYSLFYPFFFNAKGLFQILASGENLLVLLSLIIILISLFKNNKEHFFPLFLLFVCLCICFLVGLATPNSGAIFRYRSPVIAFIFIAALYYLPVFKRKSKT